MTETLPDVPVKRPRGRPPGSTGPTGPRVGSRPWRLLRMEPGDVELFIAPPGRYTAFSQQVAADVSRNGLQGRVVFSLILGVDPATREVIDIVKVTRL